MNETNEIFTKDLFFNILVNSVLGIISNTLSSLYKTEKIEPNSLNFLHFDTLLKCSGIMIELKNSGLLSNDQLGAWNLFKEESESTFSVLLKFYESKNIKLSLCNDDILNDQKIMQEFFKENIK